MRHLSTKPIPSFMWCLSFLKLSSDMIIHLYFNIVALCTDKHVFVYNLY